MTVFEAHLLTSCLRTHKSRGSAERTAPCYSKKARTRKESRGLSTISLVVVRQEACPGMAAPLFLPFQIGTEDTKQMGPLGQLSHAHAPCGASYTEPVFRLSFPCKLNGRAEAVKHPHLGQKTPPRAHRDVQPGSSAHQGHADTQKWWDRSALAQKHQNSLVPLCSTAHSLKNEVSLARPQTLDMLIWMYQFSPRD